MFVSPASVCSEIQPPERIRSEWIFVAQYVDYKSHGTVCVENPPIAHYRHLHVLKGPPDARGEVFIKYQFFGKQQPSKQGSWAFNSDMMPEPGSWWIIFADLLTTKGWLTFNGSDGRLRFNQTTFNEVMDELDAANSEHSKAEDRGMILRGIENDISCSRSKDESAKLRP